MVSYLATATIAASLLAAVPQSPQWQADYGKALEATRADNRPLLVVLDTPQESKTRLQPAYFAKEASASDESELLRPYQLCHVDTTTEYGQRVAGAFRVTQFPYTAIIDKTGSVIIYSKTGTMAPEEWKETLAKYREGNRPTAVVVASHAQTTPVSHANYDESIFHNPSSSQHNRSYCPSCQRY